MPDARNLAKVRRPLFRRVLVVNVTLSFLLAVAAVGAAYLAVGKAVEASARADIEAEIRILDQHGELHQGFGYANAISFRILPHEDAKNVDLSVRDELTARPSLSVYLLLREDHSAVVGNLSGWPANTPYTEGWLRFDGSDAGAAPGAIIAKVKGVHGNRFTLVVGRRLATYDALYQSFIPTMIIIAIAMAALSTLIIGALARRFGARVNVLNAVFAKVRSGAVNNRVPSNEVERDDELGALATEINTALDEISRLMTGLDAVSQTAAHELNKEVGRLRELAISAGNEQIRKAADALLALLSEILELARIDSALGFAMQHVDLGDSVMEAVTLYQDSYDEKGVALSVSLLKTPATILGRAPLLTNLVANLLSNALKHTPPSGSVSVTVSRDAGSVTLCVADTGPGADSESVSELVARGATGPVAGYGFGLRFVQAVAIRHGARVTLKNGQQGLSVFIVFPATQTRA
ncbi:HAMP domain-containing sensor histidine kinase [Congregibacter litoralis]|uniref:histidine kinase n=1 Tax=Congregibacter litoralis KT71 TaxID=314285 RepID=A4A4K0_9GAMM|nr:HAMP domain-containing sensor histidine kinase [Congregibacter litoralis]EAQ98721.2 Signal transduction histidine kinase [Congregibacter litoralis KT71]